jgi:hypothetical protein
MLDERNHHNKNEKDNLTDKSEKKETYLVNEKANIAEIEEKETML